MGQSFPFPAVLTLNSLFRLALARRCPLNAGASNARCSVVIDGSRAVLGAGLRPVPCCVRSRKPRRTMISAGLRPAHGHWSSIYVTQRGVRDDQEIVESTRISF